MNWPCCSLPWLGLHRTGWNVFLSDVDASNTVLDTARFKGAKILIQVVLVVFVGGFLDRACADTLGSLLDWPTHSIARGACIHRLVGLTSVSSLARDDSASSTDDAQKGFRFAQTEVKRGHELEEECAKCDDETAQLFLRPGVIFGEGCLPNASDAGRLRSVKILLESGVKVHPETIFGAAVGGRTEILQILLSKAKEQGMAPERLREAMDHSFYHNRPESVAQLLAYRVSLDKPNARLRHEMAHGHMDLVKLLKANGARDSWEDAPLAGIAAAGDVRAAEKALNEGADINKSDKTGWSPFLWACATGQSTMVKFLLEKGANPNVKGEYGYHGRHGEHVGRATPLIIAAHNGHDEVVRLLLEHRKGEGSENKESVISLDDSDGWRGFTALAIAAERGHLSIAKLLIDYGANIGTTTAGDETSPLLLAVSAGHIDVVRLLLERGANPIDQEEAQGDSDYAPKALEIATEKGHEKIRQLLLRYGAE